MCTGVASANCLNTVCSELLPRLVVTQQVPELGDHSLRIRHTNVIFSGTEQALAVIPGSTHQRRTGRQRLKHSYRGYTAQAISVKPARHVQADLAASVRFRSAQIRQITAKFDF